ncbi:hypothetical protein [Candidatus Amarobacter glycogenicus]|uniref:hypothetical protein n=1 Tax=Candidatus Amarobacter glycogenicus TaxID=3140699 RepID=UPI002A0B204C|nr:hypothetical protein [Dehalococcoidia bacterium]
MLPQAGFIEADHRAAQLICAAFNTAAIGWASVHLGAGRLVKSDQLIMRWELVLSCAVGDEVAQGRVLGMVHADD